MTYGNDAPSVAAGKPRILVVEDNYLTAKAVCDIVRDCGFAVAGAVARLDSGLNFLAERDVDGAIVDINLDGCQSFPLCTELHRRKVPFCFLTGHSDSIIPPAFRGTPMLTKPFDPAQIRSALNALAPQRAPVAAPRAPTDVGGRGNLLLQAVVEDDWRLIEPFLQRVALRAGDSLESSGDPSPHVTFPISGLVSVGSYLADQRIEVALVGREGLVGASALLGGTNTATRSVVQFAGEAWRAPMKGLAAQLERSRRLRAHLLRGVNALVEQIALNALATGRATIEQRLARWLLMAADRLDTNDIAVTHEMLAQVLGVRRAGVTVALHTLEGRQGLRSERRRVLILNRSVLLAAAGSFYRVAGAPPDTEAL